MVLAVAQDREGETEAFGSIAARFPLVAPARRFSPSISGK